MKRNLRASVGIAALLIATPVLAADIPPRAPSYPARTASVPFNWTGAYGGVHLGYGWSQWTGTTTVGGAVISTERANVNGALGGLQLGFNMQSGAMVYGLETDITLSGQRSTTTTGGVTFGERVRWFGTTRGRLGVAADRWMFYGTGGVSYTGLQSDITVGGTTDSARETKLGWTVGAGIENAISPNWTWKLEYLYIDAARTTRTAGAVTDTFRARNNVARLGVNYKF